MRRHVVVFALILGLCLGLVAWQPLGAQSAQSAASAEGAVVSVVVTAASRTKTAPPALAKDDIIVRVGNDRRPVVDWLPARGERSGLDLVIVIDDSIDTRVGLQLGDLSAFIRSLPAKSRVAVAYASNGVARFQEEFSANREQAIKELRIPSGRADLASGLYLSLIDLLQRWPQTNNRRAVLLVSDGVDLLRDVEDSSPVLNMDLKRAIEEYQRTGVAVYSIFASGAGRLRQNFYLINNGQGCLARLTFETGGESFTQGLETPLAVKPFLEDIDKLLRQQYLLSFRVQPGKKAGFERLRVTTEQSRVELIAPARVYVPAAAE